MLLHWFGIKLGILIARAPSGTDNVIRIGNLDQSLSEFAIGFTDSHAGLSEIAIKRLDKILESNLQC
jgi:hypothetical protein